MRDEDITNGCFIPAGQAAAAGVFTAILVTGIVKLRGQEANAWVVLAWAGGIALAVFLTGIVSHHNLKRDILAPFIEPPKKDKNDLLTVRIIEQPTGTTGRQTFAELPVSEETLTMIARAILAGDRATVPMLESFGLSRAQAQRLQTAFLTNGWAVKRASTMAHGIEFTRAGIAVLSHISEANPPT